MNQLLTLLTWILVVFGAANGISVSALLEPIRLWVARKSTFLGKLINCPMCLGFWLGGLLGQLWFSPTNGNFIFDCFFGSATSWLLFLLVSKRQFGT